MSLKSRTVYLPLYRKNTWDTGINMRIKPLNTKGDSGRPLRVAFDSGHAHFPFIWILSYAQQYHDWFKNVF